ncbi:MAG: site-specific integrase [Erysipelotrichaceae bacterium]|nr:site-specific integrase [Erysipelotrichaceae bacterium]
MTQTERRPGYAGIERKENGAFLLTFYGGYDGKTGKQKKIRRQYRSEKSTVAAQWNDAKYHREFLINENNKPESARILFKDFFEIWKAERQEEIDCDLEGCLTISVYETCEDCIRDKFLPDLGNLYLDEITKDMMQKSVNKMIREGKKQKTIKKYFSNLSNLFSLGVEKGKLKHNPCKELRYNKDRKDANKNHVFTVEEEMTFFNVCENGITIHHDEIIRKNGRRIPEHDETIEIPFQFLTYYTLALQSGLRRGELIALRWSDIDFIKSTVRVEKSTASIRNKNRKTEKDPTTVQIEKETKTKSSERTVPLPDKALELLSEWREQQYAYAVSLGDAWEGQKSKNFSDQYIFITATGKQMNLHTPCNKLSEIINNYNLALEQKAEGLDAFTASLILSKKLPAIHLHDLRHTYGSRLLSKGVPLADVSKLMGHSSVQITAEIYLHSTASPEEMHDNVRMAFSYTSEPKENRLTSRA